MRFGDVQRSAAARPDLVALAALVLAGALLRLWLMLEWRPAFLGYPDSYGYISNSEPRGYFHDGLRSIGYPLFLAAGRQLSSSLSATVLLQHLLGIGAALCAYAAARALGVRRWPALLPAAVLLLHGSSIWFEHSILTEAVFPFVVCAALAAAALAARADRSARRRAALAALAGALLAFGVAVRPVLLPCVPLVAAWLALAAPGPIRPRLAPAGALLGTAAALVLANLVWAESETGRFTFARDDYKALYGRVAPFADCDRFTPPAGTERFCPVSPRAVRHHPGWWVFDQRSPLAQVREEGRRTRPADAHELVGAFSRAAIRAQPGDYLEAVGRDLVRLADPDGTPGRYPPRLTGRTSGGRAAQEASVELVARMYSSDGIRRGELGGLEAYERATRLDGVPWLVLLLLGLCGPLALRGAERRAAAMAAAVAVVLTVTPIAIHAYDWRFQLVALGPLSIAAAFGLGAVSPWARRVRR